MCGIAGFSLNPASKINARALGHFLLASIEQRGRHASGTAYHNHHDGRIHVHKGAVAGSNLQLKGMPRDTKTAIFHTRYATQGKPEVNENNHPVMSPSGDTALVHNGVIWNDWHIRKTVLEGVKMPEVDTAVIPALLEQQGLKGIGELSGDAAVAWLHKDAPHMLHLARIESSPVHYTNLEDGSFVFASTASLLMGALDEMGLIYGEIFALQELDYYKLRGGVIWRYAQTPEPALYGTGVAASSRGATSGGRGGTTFQQPKTTTTTNIPITGAASVSVNKDGVAEMGTPTQPIGTGFVGASFGKSSEADAIEKIADKWSAADDKRLADAMDKADLTPMFMSGEGVEPSYFTVDHDGNIQTYMDLDELETALIYAAGRSEGEFGQGMSKWVNNYKDIGSFGFKDGELLSWLDEPSEIGYHDPMSNDGLGYIKDGVGILQSMEGR